MKHINAPIIICVIFILLGYFSKKYPKTISSYEKLDAEQKIKVPAFINKVSIITGLIVLIGCFFSMLLKNTILYTIFLILPIVVMPLVIILKIYRGSKKTGRPILIVYILVLVAIVGFTVYSTDTEMKINNDKLTISGLYEQTIDRSEIRNVEWMDSTPSLGLRTNGFSLGYIKKGNFKYQDTRAKVFIETENKPSIILHLKNDKVIILSLKDRVEMDKIYNSLK